MDSYSENIKAVVQTLTRANQSIYSSMVMLFMQGEMKEWNDAVPDGEIHQFEFALFQNCIDVNVQSLVKLIEYIDENITSIKNVNGIKEDDLV